MVLAVFLIAFGASTVGAMAGIGGGVIIKPLLDALNLFPAEQIGLYSSATVFAMAVASLVQNLLKKVEIDFKLGFKIFIGATLGGFIGSSLLGLLGSNIGNTDTVTVIQAITLIIFLVISILLIKFKDNLNIAYFDKSILPIFIGISLGSIASFLSIGGGPINVAFIAVLLGFELKKAVLYSILTIFFSQATNLTLAAFNGDFTGIDHIVLLFMMVGGVIGGLLGTKLSSKVHTNTLRRVFYMSLVGIILLEVYVISINI